MDKIDYTYEAAKERCEQFATAHQIDFIEDGSVGFGRPCVGFSKDSSWIAYNPSVYLDKDPYIEELPHLQTDNFHSYEIAPHAYHKDNYFVVLKTYDNEPDVVARQQLGTVLGLAGADTKTVEELNDNPAVFNSARSVIELAQWVDHVEYLGVVSIESYDTKRTGLALVFNGGKRLSPCIVAR